MANPTAFGGELSVTAQALGDLGQSFLDLLPGIVVGLGVFGFSVLLSGFVKRSVLRATRGSGFGQAVSRLARLGVLLGGLLVSMAVAFPTVNGSSILSALGGSARAGLRAAGRCRARGGPGRILPEQGPTRCA